MDKLIELLKRRHDVDSTSKARLPRQKDYWNGRLDAITIILEDIRLLQLIKDKPDA